MDVPCYYWHCRVCGECNIDNGVRRVRCPTCGAVRKRPDGLSVEAYTELLERDGYACSWPGCGRSLDLELHHIISRHFGGTNVRRNVLFLCHYHHVVCHPNMPDERNYFSYEEYLVAKDVYIDHIRSLVTQPLVPIAPGLEIVQVLRDIVEEREREHRKKSRRFQSKQLYAFAGD